MLIDFPNKSLPPSKLHKLSWKEEFRRSLYRSNKQSILSSKKPAKSHRQATQAIKKYFFKNIQNYNLRDAPLVTPHGLYCNFMPLSIQCKFEDELLSIPYFQHLSDHIMIDELHVCLGEVQMLMAKATTEGKCFIAWQRILEKYVCSLDSIRIAQAYLQGLKYGIEGLQFLWKEWKLTCIFAVFLQKITQLQQSMINSIPSKIHHSLKLSLQFKDEIDEVSMPKTMKWLFCVICLVYDCGQHSIDDKELQDTSYQYYSQNNMISKEDKIRDAVYIWDQWRKIIKYPITHDKQNAIPITPCSLNCYRTLNSSKLAVLQKNRNRLLSPMVKGLIKLGIIMYSFKPCDIKIMLNGVDCNLIFLYLVDEFDICRKVEWKLWEKQEQMLMFEQEENNLTNERPNAIQKRGRKKKNNQNMSLSLPCSALSPQTNTSLQKQNQQSQRTSKFTTCFHFLLPCPPSDLSCSSCACAFRGYCLSECLCDASCPIRKRGCRCKKGQCWMKGCPCFDAKEQCEPDICAGCYQQGKKKNCRNNQISKGIKKRVRIGKSEIAKGGLGAFADEPILKDDLVMTYTGELIDHELDSLRQSLSYDLSFYNFSSPQGTIDARYKGNKARFVNHGDSGNDNLRAMVVKSKGRYRIGFFAERFISKGEELLVDYDGAGQLYKNFQHKYPFINKKKKGK